MSDKLTYFILGIVVVIVTIVLLLVLLRKLSQWLVSEHACTLAENIAKETRARADAVYEARAAYTKRKMAHNWKAPQEPQSQKENSQ